MNLGFRRISAVTSASSRSARLLAASTLTLVLGLAEFGLAACSEKPTVWMNERTAATHLRAKRDLELPASMAWIGGIQEVTLLVTVDRKGRICEVEPTAGLAGLISEAVKAVRKHWRYRPFLVDWKPVVAQFPVTVRFFPPKQEDVRRRTARVFGLTRRAAARS